MNDNINKFQNTQLPIRFIFFRISKNRCIDASVADTGTYQFLNCKMTVNVVVGLQVPAACCILEPNSPVGIYRPADDRCEVNPTSTNSYLYKVRERKLVPYKSVICDALTSRDVSSVFFPFSFQSFTSPFSFLFLSAFSSIFPWNKQSILVGQNEFLLKNG